MKDIRALLTRKKRRRRIHKSGTGGAEVTILGIVFSHKIPFFLRMVFHRGSFILLKARSLFPMVGNPLLKHLVLVERSRVRSPVILGWPTLFKPHIVVHEIIIHCRHSHPDKIVFVQCTFSAKMASPCMSSHSLHPLTFGGETLRNPKVGTKFHAVLLHCQLASFFNNLMTTDFP